MTVEKTRSSTVRDQYSGFPDGYSWVPRVCPTLPFETGDRKGDAVLMSTRPLLLRET